MGGSYLVGYLQITRGVITTLDWTVKTQTVFPDLCEPSVLELQAGLDAGHFFKCRFGQGINNRFFCD